MTTTPYSLASFRASYWDLFDSLIVPEAFHCGIIDTKTDIVMYLFMREVWNNKELRQWLRSADCLGEDVCLTRWLRLIGWMRRSDMFPYGISKRTLASYLFSHLELQAYCREETFRSYMNSGKKNIRARIWQTLLSLKNRVATQLKSK